MVSAVSDVGDVIGVAAVANVVVVVVAVRISESLGFFFTYGKVFFSGGGSSCFLVGGTKIDHTTDCTPAISRWI